jgi:hypothetical protein
MGHKNTSWHHPKSYSEVTAVIESGHMFHVTPHGLRGSQFRAPVCGTDGSEADILFYGWRDDFSTDAVNRIRETQHRRHGKYMGGEGRTEHLTDDITYAVAYKGQCLGYVTVGREVRMNKQISTAGTAAKRAYVEVKYALTQLAKDERSHHFQTEGD